MYRGIGISCLEDKSEDKFPKSASETVLVELQRSFTENFSSQGPTSRWSALENCNKTNTFRANAFVHLFYSGQRVCNHTQQYSICSWNSLSGPIMARSRSLHLRSVSSIAISRSLAKTRVFVVFDLVVKLMVVELLCE